MKVVMGSLILELENSLLCLREVKVSSYLYHLKEACLRQLAPNKNYYLIIMKPSEVINHICNLVQHQQMFDEELKYTLILPEESLLDSVFLKFIIGKHIPVCIMNYIDTLFN